MPFLKYSFDFIRLLILLSPHSFISELVVSAHFSLNKSVESCVCVKKCFVRNTTFRGVCEKCCAQFSGALQIFGGVSESASRGGTPPGGVCASRDLFEVWGPPSGGVQDPKSGVPGTPKTGVPEPTFDPPKGPIGDLREITGDRSPPWILHLLIKSGNFMRRL